MYVVEDSSVITQHWDLLNSKLVNLAPDHQSLQVISHPLVISPLLASQDFLLTIRITLLDPPHTEARYRVAILVALFLV